MLLSWDTRGFVILTYYIINESSHTEDLVLHCGVCQDIVYMIKVNLKPYKMIKRRLLELLSLNLAISKLMTPVL